MTERTPEEQELFTQLGHILQGCSEGDLTLTPVLIDGIERRSRELIASNPADTEAVRRMAGFAVRESFLKLMEASDFAVGAEQSEPWKEVRNRLTVLTGLEPLD